jgi:putative transposase
MKYAFIEKHRTQHSVRRLCTLLEVSAAGYYESRERPQSARVRDNIVLLREIQAAHSKSRGTYGRPRIHADLRAQGICAGPNRVARLMKSAGLKGISPRRFRRTTDSNHTLPIADNLVGRRFKPAAVESSQAVWAGDITYLRTREGWLYLAVVMNLASRRIIGWSMDTTMQRSLVIRALRAAVAQCRPQPQTIFHSDRGSQYASTEFREELQRHKFLSSMSAKGDCWDNAVVESFFGTLKSELGDPIWETRTEARKQVFNYIEAWYNRHRRHSTLGYLSPSEYELRRAS